MSTEFKRCYRSLVSIVMITIPWTFVLAFYADHQAEYPAKIILPFLWVLETWILIKWWVFEGKDN